MSNWRASTVATPAMCATLLWAILLLPPVRVWFEASMFRHMMFQLPTLFVIGWIWGRRASRFRATDLLQRANRWGATGLLLALVTMTLWMLPRLLDSARLDIQWAVAKFVSIPILAGAAASLSWSRCPPLARGVIHLEVIATFMRYGWVYLATEDRLCLSYLLGDQRQTGIVLCCLGGIWAVLVAWRPLFGSMQTEKSYVS